MREDLRSRPVSKPVKRPGHGADASNDAPARPISPATFALLRDLLYRESGIHLSDDKVSLLVARLGRRLRELRLHSFEAYYEHVMGAADGKELAEMLDCITTNETHFFREAGQFEFLENVVFPKWRRAGEARRRTKRLRAWSAACSTGEEPYSLAMSMLRHFPAADGWTVEVLGTDLSNRALAVARAGIWSIDQSTRIPPAHLKRFMRRGVRSQQGKMSAGEELRSVVQFERVNLHAERYPMAGTFDVILCRNVLIYFGSSARASTLKRVSGLLGGGGYLLLGHAENPARALDSLEPVQTMIYRRGPEGAPGQGP